MTNPLLTDWGTPFGLPPFAAIDDAHYAPAFDAALEVSRARVAAVADSPDAPTFANTIEALERVDEPLEKVLAPFYAVLGTCSTPEREELARGFAPRLAAYGTEVSGNAALFARVEDLWSRRDDLDLTDEQARLLMLTHRGFVRGGARLTGDDKDRYGSVMTRLAELGTEFTQTLLADERDWSMAVPEALLADLPGFLADALRAAGEERGTGPVVTLSRSLLTPFLQFCPDRDLRRRAHQAWSARGEGEGRDNRAIAAETLGLRADRASLLGYDGFAAFKLETEMAGTADAVRELLMQVWEPARTAALQDAEALTARLHADGHDGPLEPWDWRYYSEARRLEEHALDEGEIKQFFPLDQMIEAAFDCAHRLFGLEFAPLDVPLYHPDCRAWEVTRNGQHVAVFIGDYFARAGKRSGAWCSAIRKQQKLAGDIASHVVNVCNFAKGDPALLSFDDARTLFHEFGHALHQMLSDVTYGSLSGTSVARDFVELPSQLYEHWLNQPEVLDRFARHAQTGAPIPVDLRDRLLAAGTYDAGFAAVEFLGSALVDLDFHEGPPPADPMQRQAEVLERIGMPRAITMRHATPQFAHVFSGDGYSCGYYSYMWSEVMDADAFAAFREAGDIFDAATARKLEEHILSRGGTVEAADLYTAFRGRMPGVEPMLRERGLLPG